MNIRTLNTIRTASAVLLVLFTASAFGQAPAKQYKMTTPIPDGVAIPGKVESRLGTLRFFDGFPDDKTVEKLYDNLAFQRAVQAYLLGLAPVNQLANRKGMAALGPFNYTVPIFEDRIDSKSLFRTPNNKCFAVNAQRYSSKLMRLIQLRRAMPSVHYEF